MSLGPAFQHARDLVVLLEADGTIVEASRSHEEVVGRSPEELAGTRRCGRSCTRPTCRCSTPRSRSARAGSPTLRFRDGSGGWRFVELSLTRIPEDGRRLAIGRVVTDRVRNDLRRETLYAVTRVLAGAGTIGRGGRGHAPRDRAAARLGPGAAVADRARRRPCSGGPSCGARPASPAPRSSR